MHMSGLGMFFSLFGMLYFLVGLLVVALVIVFFFKAISFMNQKSKADQERNRVLKEIAELLER